MKLRRPPVPDVPSFAAWLASVPGGKMARGSIRVYASEVGQFLAFAGRPRRGGYTRIQVEAWLASRQIEASTATRSLGTLKKLFEFTGQPDATNGIKRPRRDKRLPQPVEGLPFLLKRMADEGERDLMWTAIFLASTGLRISEACGENGCKFTLIEDGSALRVSGKGSKDRIVPLDDSARTALAMLTPPHGTPRIPFTVKQLQAATRPYGFHPHQLRHWAATTWYERTRDIYVVSRLMGHASTQTTQVYADISTDVIREAMNGRNGATA